MVQAFQARGPGAAASSPSPSFPPRGPAAGAGGGDGSPGPLGLLPGLACFLEGPVLVDSREMGVVAAGAAASGLPPFVPLAFDPQQAPRVGGGDDGCAHAMEAMPPLATAAMGLERAALEGWEGVGMEGESDEMELLHRVFQEKEEQTRVKFEY